MAWKLKGRYVASCSCTNVCPCATASAPPDNPDGTTICWGAALVDVRDGNLDGVGLSGVRFALLNMNPDIVSAGNWKLGVIVDDGASEEQVKALGEILSGQQGGPFAELSALVAELAPMERASINISDAGGSYGGNSFSYEPLRGADGNPTTVRNAAFGFAPEFEIGSTTGQLEVFGHSFPASYGESADFEWTSEAHDQIRG